MLRVIWQDFKDKKWSLISYSLGSIAMLWLYVATFRTSQNSTQQLQELVKTYPKAFLDAFGLSNISMDTIEEYLNAKHFSLLWPLLAIIISLSRSAGQIAGEIQSGTMGLLLALPLKRWQIFFSKYVAGLMTVFIFSGVSVFGVFPLAAMYHVPTHHNILFAAWILTALFMWAMYSFGIALSTLVNDKSKVYTGAGTLLFLTYGAYIAALISEKIIWLKYISPFYYFNTQEVLSHGYISSQSYCIFVSIIVITSIFGCWKFQTRDIFV